jgi:regulator of sigma E protease
MQEMAKTFHASSYVTQRFFKLPPKRHIFLCAAGFGIALWALCNPQAVRTIGIFALMLSTLVFLHELGHFQCARWAGMRINRFAVGFPPWLWSRSKKGVQYSIGALPIGGMVDIAGLGSERDMVSHLKGEEGENRAVASSDQKLFQHASLGWRFLTLFAGPLMNMLYAMVVFIAIYSLIGVPEPYNTNRIDQFYPHSPALAAGLKTGDRWVGVNAGGADFRSTDVVQLKNFVRRSGQTIVTTIVQRGGSELRLPVHRLYREADAEDPVKDKQGKPLPLTGLEIRFQIVTPYRKLSVAGAIQQGWGEVTGMWHDLSGLLFRAATVQLTASDRNGVGGPVKMAEMVGQYTVLGWPALVILSGVLSVNLAIMNLLPLPALDGGRILFLGYEWVAGQPLDSRIENRVHALGMTMLLAFMGFLTLRDVVSLIFRLF